MVVVQIFAFKDFLNKSKNLQVFTDLFRFITVI